MNIRPGQLIIWVPEPRSCPRSLSDWKILAIQSLSRLGGFFFFRFFDQTSWAVGRFHKGDFNAWSHSEALHINCLDHPTYGYNNNCKKSSDYTYLRLSQLKMLPVRKQGKQMKREKNQIEE